MGASREKKNHFICPEDFGDGMVGLVLSIHIMAFWRGTFGHCLVLVSSQELLHCGAVQDGA